MGRAIPRKESARSVRCKMWTLLFAAATLGGCAPVETVPVPVAPIPGFVKGTLVPDNTLKVPLSGVQIRVEDQVGVAVEGGAFSLPRLSPGKQFLVAENARIGEAKALMFPQIALTGDYGVVSNDLDTLISSAAQSWTIIPSLFQSIFDAGKNKNRVRAQESRQKQAILNYQQTMLLAFREVEDALVSYRKSAEQQISQGERVRSLRQVLTLSEARYRGGVAEYLEVLDAQRSLLSAELDDVDTMRTHVTSLVRLYKALGGGWPYEPQPEPTAQQ